MICRDPESLLTPQTVVLQGHWLWLCKDAVREDKDFRAFESLSQGRLASEPTATPKAQKVLMIERLSGQEVVNDQTREHGHWNLACGHFSCDLASEGLQGGTWLLLFEADQGISPLPLYGGWTCDAHLLLPPLRMYRFTSPASRAAEMWKGSGCNGCVEG